MDDGNVTGYRWLNTASEETYYLPRHFGLHEMIPPPSLICWSSADIDILGDQVDGDGEPHHGVKNGRPRLKPARRYRRVGVPWGHSGARRWSQCFQSVETYVKGMEACYEQNPGYEPVLTTQRPCSCRILLPSQHPAEAEERTSLITGTAAPVTKIPKSGKVRQRARKN